MSSSTRAKSCLAWSGVMWVGGFSAGWELGWAGARGGGLLGRTAVAAARQTQGTQPMSGRPDLARIVCCLLIKTLLILHRRCRAAHGRIYFQGYNQDAVWREISMWKYLRADRRKVLPMTETDLAATTTGHSARRAAGICVRPHELSSRLSGRA